MLSDSKQNIFDPQKPQPQPQTQSQSTTRRHSSTHSTSACKKMLRSICGDMELNQSRTMQNVHLNGSGKGLMQVQSISVGEGSGLSIREIKLKQVINFLQKKNAKLTQQLTTITHDLNTVTKLRQTDLTNLQHQMQKIHKSQQERNSSNKTISDLKKRITELQTLNTSLRNKNTEMEKKFIRFKEVLRKKECAVGELSAKVEGMGGLEEQVRRYREEVVVLRGSFGRVKEKEGEYQEENKLLKERLTQCMSQNKHLQSQLYITQQSNTRLQSQLTELEHLHTESQTEHQTLQAHTTELIQQQARQLSALRTAMQKLQNLQSECKDGSNGSFIEVYKEEIAEILRTGITDRGLRGRVQGRIWAVVEEMGEAMNRVLVQVVAANL